jgi:glycosyltransferase involved in cell wall biosynthesis
MVTADPTSVSWPMNSSEFAQTAKQSSRKATKQRTLFLLTKNTGWYGRHSGYYEQLPKYLGGRNTEVEVIRNTRNPMTRLVGKLYASYRRWPQRDQSQTYAELLFVRKLKAASHALGHILNFEEHHVLFRAPRKEFRNVVATIHIPPASWSEETRKCLPQLTGAIALYRRDIGYLENYVGPRRAIFIHHGVDTNFFRPGEIRDLKPRTPRLLFVGQYLRNTEMLYRVVQKLQSRHPRVCFDFVVPRHVMDCASFRELRSLSGIEWHHAVSDESLLLLYQSAYLLLLPMNDSGANNAVVEALAVGLPIVTTDVGGIRDYGGDVLFPVVANNDDSAMVSLLEVYLNNFESCQKVARKQREFALQELSWPRVARRHWDAYHDLLLHA